MDNFEKNISGLVLRSSVHSDVVSLIEYLLRTVTYQTVKAMDQKHQDDWLFSNWQNLKEKNNSKQDNQLDNKAYNTSAFKGCYYSFKIFNPNSDWLKAQT